MCRTASLSYIDNCSANLIEYFLGVLDAKAFNSSGLEREQGHQMLTHLTKGFWILSTTNTFVVLDNAFRESRLAKLDIANDCEPRQLTSEAVNLSTPIRVLVQRHGLVIEVQVVLPAGHAQQNLPHDGDVVPMVGIHCDLSTRTCR